MNNPKTLKQAAEQWVAFSVKAGRGRAVVRHWIKGPNGQRSGHYPNAELAQAAADKANSEQA